MSTASAWERLEAFEALLADLAADSEELPVLVEGEKDEAALRILGLRGAIIRVKGGRTIFALCEHLAREHRKVIILTDWDRGGGHAAQLLQEGLEANGVRFDIEYRRALARATRKEITQVEDLPRFLDNLRLATRKHPGRRQTLK